MDGVGGREAVMDDIPVAVVILNMEASEAKGGGVRYGPSQFLGGGAYLGALVERRQDVGRFVPQDGPGQRVHRFRGAGGGRPCPCLPVPPVGGPLLDVL